MAINGNYAGNVDASEHYATTNVATTAGSAAADFSRILAGFAFANTSAAAVTCQVIHRQNATDYTVWTGSVAAGVTTIVDNLPVRLGTGDSIKLVGNTGVTATLTYISSYALGGQG